MGSELRNRYLRVNGSVTLVHVIMLQQTFVHVQGIGYQTERRLWEQGVDSWQTLLADPSRFRIPRAPLVLDTARRSQEALRRGDHQYFRTRLAARDHWRALHAFPGRVAYLDIETDGGTDFDSVTVIGLYDGQTLRQFVRGENLLEFPDALSNVALLVTFFGSVFDIPVLKTAFPRLNFDQLHLDLCFAFRKLGIRGGLKSIERRLGLARSDETTGLDGMDAVRLWNEWRHGSEEALHTLLAYNAEDVVNMAPLARIAYRSLREQALDGLTLEEKVTVFNG